MGIKFKLAAVKCAPILAAAALLFSQDACKRRQHSQTQTSASTRPVLPASTIAMGDPQYAPQLLHGFYPIERSWRWTQKSFAVRLAPPGGAAQKGAQLQLRFGIPDTIIQNLHSLTLSAAVDGFPLAPQRFEKAGQFTYTRDVAGEHLQSNSVPVEFTLDRALPPGPVDQRELGIVVSEVGLTAN